MQYRHRVIAAALCLSLVPAVLFAQRDKAPRRPRLPAAADTNDALAYYDFGLANLKGDPDKAADAFYWSSRLDPMSADALYARRIALLLSNDRRLMLYWQGDRHTVQSDAVKRIDSLYYFALTLNPFLSRRLDSQLFQRVVDQITLQAERSGETTRSEMQYEIDRYLSGSPASMRAWLAYGEGRFPDAIALYAQAVHDARKEDKSALRMERGRLFMQMGNADSALVELQTAIQDMRDVDKKDLVYVYQSKALLEHSIATVQRQLGHNDAAHEALGRALEEDLSYYPAHVQLSYLALDSHDTTTALAEMDLAVQLKSDDAGVRYAYGYTLWEANKLAEAETQLRKAIELNAVYAAPHFVLAQTLDKAHRAPEALAEYRKFLSVSPQRDPRRAEAEARLTALGSGEE